MERLKEEINRQIDENQKYIDDNLAYDYEQLNFYIDNVFVDENVNFEYLDMLLKVDYLKSYVTDLSKMFSQYINLIKLKSMLEGGISNIDISEYEKIINSCPEKILSLLNEKEISKDKIAYYKTLIEENNLFDVSFIDNYVVSSADIEDNLIKSSKEEIKELIKALKNKVSELQYQDYNSSNNRHRVNAEASDIHDKIIVCKDKIYHLNNMLDSYFQNNGLIPCSDLTEFNKIMDFIRLSGLSKRDKASLMLNIQIMHAEFLSALSKQRNETIIEEIDDNRQKVFGQIEEQTSLGTNEQALNNQEPDVQEVSEQPESNLDVEILITFADIIESSVVDSWNLSEEEKADFNYLKGQVEKYINNLHPTSSILEDEDYKMFLDDINIGGSSRAEIMIDDSLINWEFVIYYLHNCNNSKEDIFGLIRELERINKIKDLSLEIGDYINDSMLLYANNTREDVDSLINSFSMLEAELRSIDLKYITDEQEYENLLKEYDKLKNTYYTLLVNSIEKDSVDAKLDKINLIIFGPRVKRQLDDYADVVYSTRLWDAIDILRKKERFETVNDQKLKYLKDKEGMGETKSETMRCYFFKVANNIYYVPAIGRHTDDKRDSLYQQTLIKYAKEGKSTVADLKEQIKTMVFAEIYDMCEGSFSDIMDVLVPRIRGNKAKQMGGEQDGSNQ